MRYGLRFQCRPWSVLFVINETWPPVFWRDLVKISALVLFLVLICRSVAMLIDIELISDTM